MLQFRLTIRSPVYNFPGKDRLLLTRRAFASKEVMHNERLRCGDYICISWHSASKLIDLTGLRTVVGTTHVCTSDTKGWQRTAATVLLAGIITNTGTVIPQYLLGTSSAAHCRDDLELITT
jgi:hypothetical protein